MGRFKTTDYIRLTRAAPLVYKLTGVSRSKHTVRRWHLIGKSNSSGEMIKLKSVLRLGKRYTTVYWLKKFIKEVSS